MDIKQIREIKDRIRKNDEDSLYAMFSAEERALISEYIRLSTHNGENEFFIDRFKISDSYDITLSQLNNCFAPKFEISKVNPFIELTEEELRAGKDEVMDYTRICKKEIEKNRKLEKYIEDSIKDKKKLWNKIASIFDENSVQSNKSEFVEFLIDGNKEITICGKSSYIRIKILPGYEDDIDINVTSLAKTSENQSKESILRDKIIELEEIEKWVDKKIEETKKYIKEHGLDDKYLVEK